MRTAEEIIAAISRLQERMEETSDRYPGQSMDEAARMVGHLLNWATGDWPTEDGK